MVNEMMQRYDIFSIVQQISKLFFIFSPVLVSEKNLAIRQTVSVEFENI